MRRLQVKATVLVSALLAVIGIVLIVETALLGGGMGFLLGAMFLLAGGLRIYLLRR
ncbi:MAG: hypothetical protein H0U03_06665 [Actinobacteria bacterium]|nr:hypothetical protein [Actinomycetota bacterium]